MCNFIENNSIIQLIKRGRVAVCGVGISNMPLINLLLQFGARVTARDQKSRERLGTTADILEASGVELILGDGYLDGLDEDVIFRTPGLRPDIPELTAAAARGVYITSEMELFMELTPATVIGITGSDGKTTTTTLTYLMLKAHSDKYGGGRVYVGGNIGTPLIEEAQNMRENDFAVVEMSSFQLQTLKISPERAALTNISPNHLDWHKDIDEYAAAKLNICAHRNCSYLTVNAENERTYEIGSKSPHFVTFFSSVRKSYAEIVPRGRTRCRAIYERDGMICLSDGENEERLLNVSDILLPGRHNVENYMTAIANVYGLVSNEVLSEIARTFRGVEHRLEFVRELDGVKYYNSSIDSSPSRTAAALLALPVKPVVICGGYDKKIPFEPLADALCEHAAAVVLTGHTAGKIKSALEDCRKFAPELLEVVTEPEFEAAVNRARRLACSGGVVLLSPACASFDNFVNFEQRGNYFKSIVTQFEPRTE